METCADIRGSFWLINKMARVTVMTPILLMFCAKTHLMEELAAFIRYVTWLDSDTFAGFMQCSKQHMGLDLWQALALAVFGLGNIQNVNRYSSPPPFSLLSCVVCVLRLRLCGLWQPCSGPEGCGLAQSQRSSGADGEGKPPPPRFARCYRGVFFSRGVILPGGLSHCLEKGWRR